MTDTDQHAHGSYVGLTALVEEDLKWVRSADPNHRGNNLFARLLWKITITLVLYLMRPLLGWLSL